MEVLAHINLSFSLIAFSNFNFLIEITDTENEPRYFYILTFQMSGFYPFGILKLFLRKSFY
jgi:hypothetical protein